MKDKMINNKEIDISKKLIDYHMEIEELKYDLDKNQEAIRSEIISILQKHGINEYESDYCKVRLIDYKNKKINYSKYVENLIEMGYKSIFDIKEGKKLLEYMIDNEKVRSLYKEYKNIDKDSTVSRLKLIDELIANNRLDILKFDLEDIKKIYIKSSGKDKEYLKSIINDNENKNLICDYIK